jgi:hypothetical protein
MNKFDLASALAGPPYIFSEPLRSILIAPGLALSVFGLFCEQRRGYALGGVVINGIVVALSVVVVLNRLHFEAQTSTR